MEYFFDNWYLILIAAAVLLMICWRIYIFFKKPTKEQMRSVREWLLYAVTNAEKTLGSGTGYLKLRYVYNMFVDKFWYLSRIITFETFSGLVDKALEELEDLLNENDMINEYVAGNDKQEEKESGEYEDNNNSGTQQT